MTKYNYKKIRKLYIFFSTLIVTYITCFTAILNYIHTLINMGHVEYFGYTLQNIHPSSVGLNILLFESSKLVLFVCLVHFLFWFIYKLWNRFEQKIFHTNSITAYFKKIYKIVKLILIAIISWIVLLLTGHLVYICITNIIRLTGYIEGLSHFEAYLFWSFEIHSFHNSSIWGLSKAEYFQLTFFKICLCSFPYIPALCITIFKKLYESRKYIRTVGISVIALLFSYWILSINYSAFFYEFEIQRLQSNIYFYTTTIDETLYAIAYESEDKLYLTEAYYTDESECLHINVENKMCVDKSGITIQIFPAAGGSISNYDDYIEPLTIKN